MSSVLESLLFDALDFSYLLDMSFLEMPFTNLISQIYGQGNPQQWSADRQDVWLRESAPGRVLN